MHYKLSNQALHGDIPLGNFGSFNLSEGSTNYIRGMGEKLIPDFLLNIFGTKPAPAQSPALDKNVLYVVGGGAALLVVILLMKKKSPRNGYRAPQRTYRARKKK